MNVLRIFPKKMVTSKKPIKDMVIRHDEMKCPKLVRNILLSFLF